MGLPLQSIETDALVVVDAVQQNMAIRSQWKNLLLDVLCLLSFFFSSGVLVNHILTDGNGLYIQ